MPNRMALKGLLVVGLVLLGIGLERLFNAYLMGRLGADLSPRVVIGVLCTTAGSLLLAVTGYVYIRTRR